MNLDSNDRIHIRDLSARTVIGVYPEERGIKQDLMLNLELFVDQQEAAARDDFEKTVDYDALAGGVREFVERSSYRLIESVAAAVADFILDIPGVDACRVTVDKPGAVKFSRSVAVEIFRSK